MGATRAVLGDSSASSDTDGSIPGAAAAAAALPALAPLHTRLAFSVRIRPHSEEHSMYISSGSELVSAGGGTAGTEHSSGSQLEGLAVLAAARRQRLALHIPPSASPGGVSQSEESGSLLLSDAPS